MGQTYNINKDITAFVAEKHGVSADYVRKVMRGDRKIMSELSNKIAESYMTELEERRARLKHVSVHYNYNMAN